MSKEIKLASAADQVEPKELLGPIPVLSTESEKSYHEIWDRLVHCIDPNDFLEQLLIKQLADCTWELNRYTRHKTLTIDRAFRQQREFQARRAKVRAERDQARVRAAAEKAGKPAMELERAYQLERVVDDHVEDIDAILNRPPEELDHAQALEKGIDYHERLDELLNRAILRRNDALRQIDQYRDGLGRRLRQVSDEIIDAECKDAEPQTLQVEAPLAPTGE